jgi:predicted Fe-Mo cluster-binding NifX family protein
MKIAIPVENGHLHGHFGGCRQFALVDADREHKLILATQTVAAPPHAPGLFPRWLREQGVDVVIVGGIGQRALDIFAQHGIEVRAGQPDAPVEALVTACLNGQLTSAPEGCAHHGRHDDDHGHHHS